MNTQRRGSLDLLKSSAENLSTFCFVFDDDIKNHCDDDGGDDDGYNSYDDDDSGDDDDVVDDDDDDGVYLKAVNIDLRANLQIIKYDDDDDDGEYLDDNDDYK